MPNGGVYFQSCTHIEDLKHIHLCRSRLLSDNLKQRWNGKQIVFNSAQTIGNKLLNFVQTTTRIVNDAVDFFFNSGSKVARNGKMSW